MEKLRLLVGRLSSPVVGSRLTRQELCLSFSALHQILICPQFSASPLPNDVVSGALQSSILANRVKRVSQTCTPKEIVMLAEGWSHSYWKRWDVVDNLVTAFFHQNSSNWNTGFQNKKIKISEVTALLECAIASGHYFNATLATLAEGYLTYLHSTSQKEYPADVNRFLWAVTSFFGAKLSKQIVDRMESKESDPILSQLKIFASAMDSTSASLLSMQRNLLFRQTAVQKINEDEPAHQRTSMEGARASLFLWWMDGQKPISGEILKEFIVLFIHHGFQDATLHKALEDSALAAFQTGSDTSGLSEAVYKRPEAFPRVRSVISEKLNLQTTDSVQTQRSVHIAYKYVINGIYVPEEVLLRVVEEIDVSTPDERAMACTVLMMANKLPEGIIQSLSGELSSITFTGLSALIAAMQFDTCGSLLSLVEKAMENILLTSFQGADKKELLLLSRSVGQPLSRYTSPSRSFLNTYMSLKEGLIQHWIEFLHGSDINIKDMTEIAISTKEIDEEKIVVSTVSKLSVSYMKKNLLSDEEFISILEMFAQTEYLSEELVDCVSLFVSEQIKLSLADRTEWDIVLLQFAFYQAVLDFPGFDKVSKDLIKHISALSRFHSSDALLIAVGLLSSADGSTIMVESVMTNLTQKDDVEVFCIPCLTELIFRHISVTPSALIQKLCKTVDAYVGSSPEQHILKPSDIARLIILSGRTNTELPSAKLRDVCASSLFALSPSLYTELAEVVGQFTDCEPITSALVESLPRILNRLSAQQIGRVIFGLGQIPHAGLLLTHQLASDIASDYVVDNSEMFTCGKSIARMLHGFSRLHITKRTLYAVFSERLAKRSVLATMDRASITLAMSAFGTAKFLHKELFDKFSRLFVENVKGLSSADLLLSIKAMSRVMLLDNEFYEKMGNEAAEKIDELPVKAQCELLHAFGSVDMPHDRLAKTISSSIGNNLETLSDPNTGCAVLVSLCRMGYNISEDENLDKLAGFITENVEKLTCHNLSALCAVIEDTNWKNITMLKALATHSIHLKKNEELTPECSRGVLDLLAKNFVHHSLARNELTPLARVISRDAVLLSEDEALEHQLLVSR